MYSAKTAIPTASNEITTRNGTIKDEFELLTGAIVVVTDSGVGAAGVAGVDVVSVAGCVFVVSSIYREYSISQALLSSTLSMFLVIDYTPCTPWRQAKPPHNDFGNVLNQYQTRFQALSSVCSPPLHPPQMNIAALDSVGLLATLLYRYWLDYQH